MRLSIVATLYRSALHLEEFSARMVKAAEKEIGDDFELILVNDGSPDESLKIARNLASLFPCIRVIDLSRNFGHHRAVMIGLSETRGDLVYLLDSDLEEAPEWLSIFRAELEGHSSDVAYGVQGSRKGGWLERHSGALFWALYSRLTGYDLPRNQVTARLMTRRYVDALIAHRERVLNMGVLFHLTGFAQRAVPVEKLSLSESTYTLRHKFAAAVDSVVSASSKPLVLIFFLGLATLALSFVYSLFWVAHWYLKEPPPGWATLVISIWLLGGLNMSCVGLVGIYVSKVFEETKQRPYAIIREEYGTIAPHESKT